jgi:hypothetical protein
LLAGLIQGLLYTFLIPPWQHYDEPTQFEYAWLLANHPGLPKPGTYDQAMRREVAASMIEHGFFKGLSIYSNLLSQAEPIWIGFSQTNDPPIYYWLVSLPLRLARTSDVTFQLYLGRLVSVLLYLTTLVAAYGVTAEITSTGHPLRWIIPATLALLPGYIDLMTAVNNDVGATAFFSLFLWVSLRMIRRGFTWLRLLAVIGLAAICFWTKNTVAIAVPLLTIPILFSTLRGPARRYAWMIVIIGGLAGMIGILTTGDTILAKISPIRPSGILTAITNKITPEWYYQTTAANLLRTFWGKFGWGHVPLIGHKPYLILLLVTLVGILGVLPFLWRSWRSLKLDIVILLGIALVEIWGAAFLRGITPVKANVFIPGARYAYPAIIPTVMILSVGWLEIPRFLNRWIRVPVWVQLVLYFSFFIGLDLLSVLSIARFYS